MWSHDLTRDESEALRREILIKRAELGGLDALIECAELHGLGPTDDELADRQVCYLNLKVKESQRLGELRKELGLPNE